MWTKKEHPLYRCSFSNSISDWQSLPNRSIIHISVDLIIQYMVCHVKSYTRLFVLQLIVFTEPFAMLLFISSGTTQVP